MKIKVLLTVMLAGTSITVSVVGSGHSAPASRPSVNCQIRMA